MRRIQAALLVVVGLASGMATASSYATPKGCLHGPEMTAEQRARRSALVGLARDINNQQVKATKQSKSYSALEGLTLTGPVPDGVQIKLAADAKGYSFSIVDETDECRSGVFSNESGLIYTGQALQ